MFHDFVIGGVLMFMSAAVVLVTATVSPRCPWR